MHGRVCDRVYDTGRDLLSCRGHRGRDMLPEVALVKMMWVFGNEKDPEKAAAHLMQNDLKGECNRRSAHGL
jgi:glutamyl-tRNA(Gln) amidotransferase subunit D